MCEGGRKSRPHRDILDEVRMLAHSGIREVTLLGQNVNSYGIGTNGSNYRFPDLLRDIGQIGGIERSDSRRRIRKTSRKI